VFTHDPPQSTLRVARIVLLVTIAPSFSLLFIKLISPALFIPITFLIAVLPWFCLVGFFRSIVIRDRFENTLGYAAGLILVWSTYIGVWVYINTLESFG